MIMFAADPKSLLAGVAIGHKRDGLEPSLNPFRLRLQDRQHGTRHAERLGVGSEAVSRIERGVVIPTVLRLLELASVFDCEAAELLNESSSRVTDQASRISQLLGGLSETDRQLVMGIVEQLSGRLSRKQGKAR